MSKSTFSEVLELINDGLLAEANRVCRDAIKNSPNDLNMMGLLGVVLIKMNNFEDAEKYLGKTIDLAL